MRYRDPVKVVDEIENLINNYGIKEIQIEDDNFTLKRKHAVAVCEEIIKRKIKVHWSLPNGVRIDKLDPELLSLMKKSGCYFMALGIESANQRILDIIKKHLDKNLVRKVVKMVKDKNIDWKTFNMDQFNADWAAVPAKEVERVQKIAFFKFYFTKWRIFKFLYTLKANQIFKFHKRVMSVLLTSKWYNRIFNSKSTNITFINPVARKTVTPKN